MTIAPWALSLLFVLVPWLLPRFIRLRADVRRQQQLRQQASTNYTMSPRPLRVSTILALALLAVAASTWVLSAGLIPIPQSAGATASLLPGLPSLVVPENVFVTTQTRIQASPDVLFTRLAARRPGRKLTEADEALRARFASLESRLLYLHHGPDVLTGCLFCGGTGVDAKTGFSSRAYLAYSLVDIFSAHLANLVLVAVVASPLVLLGRRGSVATVDSSLPASASTMASHTSILDNDAAERAYNFAAHSIRRWRTRASLLVLVFAAADLYLVASFNPSSNARAPTVAALEPFFWTMRRRRGLACGGMLSSLTALLWWALAAPAHTQTTMLGLLLFGQQPPPSPAARVTSATRNLSAIRSKLNAGAIVKNTSLRDTGLRSHVQAYWAREVLLVAAAMEEREVLDSVHDALEKRIDVSQIARDAELYAQSIVPPTAKLGAAKAGPAVSVSQTEPTRPDYQENAQLSR